MVKDLAFNHPGFEVGEANALQVENHNNNWWLQKGFLRNIFLTFYPMWHDCKQPFVIDWIWDILQYTSGVGACFSFSHYIMALHISLYTLSSRLQFWWLSNCGMYVVPLVWTPHHISFSKHVMSCEIGWTSASCHYVSWRCLRYTSWNFY